MERRQTAIDKGRMSPAGRHTLEISGTLAGSTGAFSAGRSWQIFSSGCSIDFWFGFGLE